MKKTKLKLFFLALIGIILIPTTNAYELGVNLNWTNANYDVEYKDAKFTLYNSSYPYIVAYPCSNSSQGSKCFSAPYYSSVIFDYSYSIHVSLDSYSFNKFFGVAYKDNWEWRDFYYSAYSDNKAVQKLFSVPSRTAFSVKMTNGKEYIMDTVYFYHNTLVFMDSRNGFTLYLNGNIKASDGVVFVDPFLKEDNLFFIRFKEKKAWSMTVSETEAWNWFFGKKSSDVLKTLKFTKSYEVREGGETIFPINFHVWKDKQGWPWYTYQEDIEFVSPEWNAGNPNNQQTGQNQALVEYNACFKYYNSIKKYTSYNYNCYKTLLDTAPLTWSYDAKKILKPWQEIEDWDWESDFAVSTENVVCNSFARVKRDYKQQYKEKWEDFLKVSSENFFYPHTMDIKWYCGERPKLEDDRNFWEKTKDFFLWRTWEPRMVDNNWKKYYANDFDLDWRKLRSLYARCQGLDKRWIMKSFSLKEDDRLKYCSEYKIEKEKFMKKWENATIWSFYWGSLRAAIIAIEWTGKGDWIWSWFFHKLKNDISNSIIWDSFSYVWEEVFGRIKAPFYSWYNSVLWVNCANSGVPHIEIMDYIAMGLFALLAFLIFKIL